MRPIFVLVLLVSAAAIIAILFWQRPTKLETESTPTSKAPLSIRQKNNESASEANTTNISPNMGQTEKTAISNNNTDESSELKIKRIVENGNVAVRFYGMVIDQDSNALSGVHVKLGVRHNIYPIPYSLEAVKNTALTHEGLQRILNPTTEVVTDNNGRFQWVDSNVTGDIVGVGSLVKDGYEQEPGQYSCRANSGNYNNPVIFKMWSTNIHEKLITGNKSFDIVPDGRLYFIRLTDGTISEYGTGDLKVWVKRPEPIISRRYDWSCGIEAINGEILQENDKSAAMYEALASGYTKSFNYEESAAANGWGDTTGEQRFYVRLNNGQKYGRISIELEAYFNKQTPGLIRLSYAINPSGSRILR